MHSNIGKPYGLHNLLSDCKVGVMDEDVLKAVWFALSEYIYDKINGKQPKVISVNKLLPNSFQNHRHGLLVLKVCRLTTIPKLSFTITTRYPYTTHVLLI